MEDLRGNTIDYIYTLSTVYGDPGPKQTLPWDSSAKMTSVAGTTPVISQILYGGTASMPANRKVNFEWEDLSGVSQISGAYLPLTQQFGWSSGMPYRIDRRISTIGTYFEEYEIRKYILQYDNKDTRRSKLASVYECAQGHCLQPTHFTYKPARGAAIGIDLSQQVPTNLGLSLKSVQAIFDADGDGLPDLLLNPNLDPGNKQDCNADFVFAHATGNRTAPYDYMKLPHGLATCDCALATDWDNDGKSELYLSSAGSNGWTSYKYTYDWPSHTLTQTPDTDMIWQFECRNPPIDLDGDGRLEFLVSSETYDFAIDTDGDGVPNPIRAYSSSCTGDNLPYDYYLFEHYNHNDVKEVDLGITQDCPTESAADQDSYIRSLLVAKQQFSTQDWATGMKVLDVNGDGLKDVLTWSASADTTGFGPYQFLKLWINTGRNQFTGGQTVKIPVVTDWTNLNSFLNAGTFKQAVVYDVGGDGREDLVFMHSWYGNYHVLMAIPDSEYGTAFELLEVGAAELPSWFRTTTSRVLVLDVDGDGAADLLMGEGTNQTVAYQKWVDHDLLDTVTDGNGRTASITYTSGKGAGIYTDYQDTLPQTDLSKPVHILPPTVRSITTTKSDGLALTESYKYKEGRVGYYGRGFLGFTEVHKTVARSDGGQVSNEHTYYHTDTLDSDILGTSTVASKMYIESGRPWKHVVSAQITSGLGSAARGVAAVVTQSRTLRQIMSAARVYMYLPWQETVTDSEVDFQGNEQVFTTATKTYNYDTYGLPSYVNYSMTGPTGTVLKSRITSTGYERGQSFLDKNLIALPKSVSTTVGNAGYSIAHNEDFDYYANGLQYHVTTESDDPNLSVTTEYHYNNRGNGTAVIQSAGSVHRETDFYYDASGDFVERRTNPLLQSTSYGYYRGYGQIGLTKDSNGLVSWRQIDSFGREISATDPNGNAVATSYEAPGSEAEFLTSEGRSIAYAVRKVYSGLSSSVTFYDNCGHDIGRTTLDVDAGLAPLHSQSYYDALGRKIYRSHAPFYAGGPSEQLDHVVYDNMNRPTSMTIATDASSSKQMTYFMDYGRASEVADSSSYGVRAVHTYYPNQSAETKVLDSDGRKLLFTDRNGNSVSYSYDATGGVATFTDQANVTVHKGYDRYGRTVVTDDPIRGVTHVQYTPLGDTVYSTTPTGNITTHYDALNRPMDETSPEGTTTWTFDKEPGAATNTPGAVGRLVNVIGPATATAPGGHSLHYTYGPSTDTVGNRGKLRAVTSTIGTEAFAVDYDYDAYERLSQTHYPALSNGSRYSVINQYTAAGRLNAVVEGDGGQGRTLWQVSARDSMGRIKTEQALGVMTTDYAYSDVDGLVTTMTTSEASVQQAGLGYAYDFEHKVTSMASSLAAGSRFYQYDSGGRITDEYAVTSSSATLIDHIDYSPNGNIAGKSDVGQYTYAELGNPYAVTSVGGGVLAYEYDSTGRVTKRTAPYVESGSQTFTWTSFDAVSTITDASATPIQTSYEYNGLKERVLETNPTQRKVRVGGVYQRTDDLASDNRLHSMQIKAGGVLIAEVQFTDDGKGTVGGPSVYSIHSDRLGSTTVVRDPSGSYTTRSYDVFGTASDKTPLSSSVGFAGYDQDDNQSLLWLTNRPYDSHIGRNLTPDGIINGSAGQDGANRYAYAYNRPTAVIDPSGFEGCSVGGGFVPGWACSYVTNPLSTVKPTSGTSASYAWTYVTHSGILDSYIPNVPQTQTELVPTTSGEMLAWQPDAVPTDAQTETIASLGRGLTDLSFGEGLACAQCVADLIAEGVGPQLPPEAKAAMDEGRNKAYVLTLKAWAIGAMIQLGLGWAFAPEVAVAAEGGGLAEGASAARVFWSGGEAAKAAAASYAEANGAVTLEMTATGQALESSTASMSWSAARPLWVSASADFAAGASGEVTVFHGSVVSTQSIWAQTEYQILTQNPAVTGINFHVVF